MPDDGTDDDLILDDIVDDEPETDTPNDDQNDDSEPEEFAVSFGDDEPEAVASEETAPEWVKSLRREHRELKRENEALKRAQAPVKVEIGPKPTLADFEYDEDAYETAIDEWKEQSFRAQEQEKAAQAAAEKMQARGKEIVARYETAARALPVKDFEEAQETVKDKLGVERWGWIVAGADSPEKLVYALAKNPARLDALAKIDIPARFAFEAAKLEKDMKVAQRRKAPDPDEVVRGSGAVSSGEDLVLARLEREADKTGDRSKVQKYMREQRRSSK